MAWDFPFHWPTEVDWTFGALKKSSCGSHVGDHLVSVWSPSRPYVLSASRFLFKGISIRKYCRADWGGCAYLRPAVYFPKLPSPITPFAASKLTALTWLMVITLNTIGQHQSRAGATGLCFVQMTGASVGPLLVADRSFRVATMKVYIENHIPLWEWEKRADMLLINDLAGLSTG